MDPGARRSLITLARPRHWWILDQVAACAYALLTLPLLIKYAIGPAGMLTVPVALLAFCVPIAVRRRRPLLAFALPPAGLLVVCLTQPKALVAGLVPLAYVLYTVAATCRPRTAFVGLAVSLATALASALPDFRHRGAAVLFWLLYTTVWSIGYAVGMHRRHTEDLLRTQARLAEAELDKARRGVMEERLRIARELHDLVAHSMSVITVQAGFGALVIDDRPQQARAALSAIETTGRETLAEMRQLLGVLRADDPARTEAGPELAPAPGLADLDHLAEQTAKAGVQVRFMIVGRPRDLPAGIGLSAYRIIQEALTNVVKHAAVGSARVNLDYRDDELRIEISDEGRGRAESGEPRPGHGLVGMRERVHLCGGSFQALPLPGRGFQVTARIPLPPGDAQGCPEADGGTVSVQAGAERAT